ncbi:ATP-binding protein [Piscinibacter sp.]|uniref:ATP-binding protein n=1 Tax=Piscinibacter sp. TaxID=1903157 RepID=UPI002ED34238
MVLHELGLLDSEAEESFDALARAAAALAGCPAGALSLIDADREWFKAIHGLAMRELPRDRSFGSHAILLDTLFEVPDAHADLRFTDNPLVRGEPRLRFYAAVPLQFRGATLGTLCVLDHRPRRLTADEREALHGLARVATELLRSRQRMNALDGEQRRLLDFGRASGDWMWETDAQLRYTWLSGALEPVTGLAPEALIGQTMPDRPLVDAHGAAAAHGRTLGELLARRQPFSRVVTEKPTPRGLLYVSRSAVPVFDGSGLFAGYRGTARDVSAQVEAMRRTRGQDVLLRKLSSQVPGVIFQFQMDGDGTFRYPYASEGLREMFGVQAPLDAAGDASLPLRMLHPEDSPGFVESIKASAKTLSPWQREYRIVRGDRTVRWLETRAMPERLADGGTLWHGFTADMTERKEIELALRRSEERWEMAADAAGIGIAEADLASGELSLDRRACMNHGLPFPLPGYTLEDWLAVVHADDRQATRDGLRLALESRGTLETRYRLNRPDGREVTLEITARGRYDAQGAPIGLVGTCRDVTAHLEFERMQRDKQAAERANRAKSEFLSRVSHELRTPLNGILGFAQLMSLDRVAPLAPEQQRRLDSVVRAGRHLLELINDVLDLTRIESEDFSLQPECVDAWTAIGECLALIQPLAQEAGVILPAVPVPPRAPCWVQADPRALEQVLMNLLSNAIKYNRRGGRVTVDATLQPGSQGPQVRIAIGDEGCGMSRDQQAALYQPFNRLGAEQTRTQGSGLGLVISLRLIDAMHGRLQVQSRLGVGSTFGIELPGGVGPAASPLPAHRALPAAHPPDTGPREVLYIEDEPLNMVLMEEVFRTQPRWTLLVADDGATGARIARESRPDLVLIDMNLPDTNGLALIRKLRSDPQTRLLRCIALSADAMREQIDAALAAGFDDYWTKPIDVHRVLADLARLLADPAPA